jgi:hypothetical protein
MRLGDLVVRFIADMAGWNTGVKQAQKDIDTTSKSTKDLGVASSGAALAVQNLLGAISIAATGYGIYAATQKYGAMANELRDLSYQTGISTEKLQKMQYAAVLSNTEFSRISFGINNMILSMVAAKDSTSAQAKAFADLGVNPNGKTPDQVYEEVAAALVKMKDPARRATDANTLLGRSWKDQLPYMETYISKQKEIAKAPTMSQEELDNLEEAKVSWDKLTNSLTIYSGKFLAFIDAVQNRGNVLNYLPDRSNRPKSGAGGRGGGPETPTTSSPSIPLNVGDKGFDLAGTYERAKAAFDRLLDSQKEYLSIAQKIQDTEKETLNLKSDYASDLESIDIRDPGSFRSLKMGYNKNLSKLNSRKTDLQGDLRQAGMKTIAAQRGDDASYNSLSLNIQNVNLSKDYPLTSFVKDYEKYQAQQNRSGGVIKR